MALSVGAGLEGRGVILTGATGGIGAAVAAGFAAAGATREATDVARRRQVRLSAAVRVEHKAQRCEGISACAVINVHSAAVRLDKPSLAQLTEVMADRRLGQSDGSR